MEKLLITTNNFWLGGRETYLETYLGELRSMGVSPLLLASDVQVGVPGLSHFERIAECGGEGERLRMWMTEGRRLIEQEQPRLIWAHHYDLLPAWILSRACSIPLLVTFHAPLRDAGATRHPLEAAGMAVSLHRSEYVSGVSPEVIDRVASLRDGAEPLLLPNVVSRGKEVPAPPSFPPRRFVMLSRRQKLDHLRAGVEAFVSYSSMIRGAHLVVADGDRNYEEESRTRNPTERLRRALSQLGARWCFNQGAAFIAKLRRVEFIGWTSRGRSLIRESDAVLGMGRVVLEALAEGRPAVVVGYDAAHGLLTEDRFDTFRRTNFSGRGVAPMSPEDVAGELLSLREDGRSGTSRILEQVMVGRWSRDLLDMIRNAGAAAPDELAEELEQLILSGAEDKELYRVLCRRMTGVELETAYSVLTE